MLSDMFSKIWRCLSPPYPPRKKTSRARARTLHGLKQCLVGGRAEGDANDAPITAGLATQRIACKHSHAVFPGQDQWLHESVADGYRL